jgi:hypothetical protein
MSCIDLVYAADEAGSEVGDGAQGLSILRHPAAGRSSENKHLCTILRCFWV